MNPLNFLTHEELIEKKFFGMDQKILKAVDHAQNLGLSKAPVLVNGEIGSGKKTICSFIHQQSIRKERPLILVDCQAKDIEHQLLGHRDEETQRFHRGALEEGHGGSVILENIDALGEEFQKKICKILGELSDYDLDVRIFATTTKNLSKLVAAGRFSRALFMFISTNTITLPPLRERKDDIRYLMNLFLSNFVTKSNLNIIDFDEVSIDKMMNFYWTHNLSELKSVIETSCEKATGEYITSDILTLGERKILGLGIDNDEDGVKLMSLKEAERLLIKKALIHTSENRTQAAKILGVSIRTLRNKINEYRNDGTNYFVNLR